MSSNQDFSDNSMLELFRAEVDSHTQTLSEGLLALEKDPTQLKRIEPLMRAAHSIKGAARIVGVEDGVRVSHVMEDCFVAAQSGQLVLTSEAIDGLLRGVDALVRIASPDQESPSVEDLDTIIQIIQDTKQGKPRATRKPAPTPWEERVEAESLHVPQTSTLAVVGEGQTGAISVPAILNGEGAERLRKIVVAQIATGAGKFHFDLGGVTEIGMDGLALFATLAIPYQVESLHFSNIPTSLLPLFQPTGLGMGGP